MTNKLKPQSEDGLGILLGEQKKISPSSTKLELTGENESGQTKKILEEDCRKGNRGCGTYMGLTEEIRPE